MKKKKIKTDRCHFTFRIFFLLLLFFPLSAFNGVRKLFKKSYDFNVGWSSRRGRRLLTGEDRNWFWRFLQRFVVGGKVNQSRGLGSLWNRATIERINWTVKRWQEVVSTSATNVEEKAKVEGGSCWLRHKWWRFDCLNRFPHDWYFRSDEFILFCYFHRCRWISPYFD
jgi:hypothetical protein